MREQATAIKRTTGFLQVLCCSAPAKGAAHNRTVLQANYVVINLAATVKTVKTRKVLSAKSEVSERLLEEVLDEPGEIEVL